MLGKKKHYTLGRQQIPNFARRACLHQASNYFFVGADNANVFPAATTIWNVAALGFFRRGAVYQDVAPPPMGARQQPLSVTYWSPAENVQAGGCLFGVTWVDIPAGSEWFSVAWLAPPAGTIGTVARMPFPEDFFRIKFELAI